MYIPNVFGSGVELATRTLSPGALAVETDVTFAFATAAAISPSTVYYIGLSVSGVGTVTWATSVGNPYADGQAFNVITPLVGTDFIFLVDGTASSSICGNPIVFNAALAIAGEPVFTSPYQSWLSPEGAVSVCGGSIRLLASTSVTTDITISLHSAAPPSGANQLATTSRSYAVLEVAEEFEFTFAAPVAVTGTTIYYLAVSSANLGAITVIWQYSLLDAYGDGTASTLVPLIGADFRFLLRGVVEAVCGDVIAQNDGLVTGTDALLLGSSFVQSFVTASDTNSICGGTIRLLATVPLPLLSISFTATLRRDSPVGTILASVVVSNLQVLTIASDFQFEFPSPASVTPSTTYYLQIASSDPLTLLPYTVGTSYLPGQAFVDGISVPAGQDYIFSVLGSPLVGMAPQE